MTTTASTASTQRRLVRVEIEPWRLLVGFVVIAAAVILTLAGTLTFETGLERPWVVAAGVVVATAINYVYVVVVRKGESLEAIDLSEAPMVALALLLPMGPALLTFAMGSLISEAFRDRALVKRAFNVGIRVIAAGGLVAIADVTGFRTDPGAAQVVAVVGGAVVYTAVTTLGVGAVIALAEQRRLLEDFRDGLLMRGAVWASAVAYGVAAALVVNLQPALLPGLLAPLTIVWLTTGACRRAESDRERLQSLIAASEEIHAAADEDQQEAALVRAAQRVLLWRDVSVRDTPPTVGEAGERLWLDRRGERWLVASPRPGGDPLADSDARTLQALRDAASTVLERIRLESELVRQAHVDPLTGVANRRAFEQALDEALLAGGSSGVAVMLLDLDGFKQINDTLGHDAGDQLLTVLAARLSEAVRSGDLVARLGGDEFVVMLRGVATSAAAARATDGVCRVLEQPVEVGDWRLSPGVSAGVAVAPFDGLLPRDLLRCADERMYDAKRARRSGRHEMLAVEAAQPPSVVSG
jgi:diguanylate cyclase (GGDEF)-like protein